jgi:hypothetical protein
VKKWLALVNLALTAEYGPAGWDGSWTPLAFNHDDIQVAVRDVHVEKIQKIILEKITEAGILLGCNIRLDGDSKCGRTWYDTH